MAGTLVEISGQKRWMSELRLPRACSFSSGCGSFSIASSPPAELGAAIVATAICLPPPQATPNGSKPTGSPILLLPPPSPPARTPLLDYPLLQATRRVQRKPLKGGNNEHFE
ncbi:unnamed protein product [Spirodela intermedia]|uniref:Uncharacterized protein n=2 Tax=Spirodela intermedia TaxID=51605 RepID=A0A7I8LIX1_SPIIN|nr:unnamed protein product [Spirodela intermedia]CAA6672118.1 unnamed protein product [Spirodela intermedia]CAA7409268.1 unnamed protein product [Spirodela intermedia]